MPDRGPNGPVSQPQPDREDRNTGLIDYLTVLDIDLSKPATGPTRLYMTRPELVERFSNLGEFSGTSVRGIQKALDRVREEAGITDPLSITARATDAACMLGYLSALADTMLALHFMTKDGRLPKNPKTLAALRWLATALDHASLPKLVNAIHAAVAAKEKAPLETLFTALLPARPTWKRRSVRKAQPAPKRRRR